MSGQTSTTSTFSLNIFAIYKRIYLYTCSTSVTQSKASDFYTTEKVALWGQPFPFI